MGRTNVAVTSIERRRVTSTLASLESYDLPSEVLLPEQFFILGYRSLMQLFSTHPPLEERIARSRAMVGHWA